MAWLKNYKSCHGIRQLSIQGEKMSTDTECVCDFNQQLANMIEKEQLTLNQVYNCDETGLCWKVGLQRIFGSFGCSLRL